MSIDASSLAAVLVGAPDPEIVELEARVRAAQLGANAAELDALLAEDLLFTGPDGSLATKAQDLAAHRSGVVKFREHVPTELRVRRIGSTVALTMLNARLAVEVSGTVVRGDYRYTRVWALDDTKRWQVVGGHVSAVSTRA